MKKYLYVIFILILCSSCLKIKPDEKNCKDCKEFVEHYMFIYDFQPMDTIDNTLENFLASITFLGELTGHESNAYFGDTWGYIRKSNEIKDLWAWKRWYKKNCPDLEII